VKILWRLKFAHLPTPIELLPRLSDTLGGPQIFVKRDDLTGLAFGGNKTRKLEYLLAEAQAAGAKTLITAGAIQSNHCRQTAAAAARFNMECVLVLVGTEPTFPSGNLLLDRFLGAEVVWTSREARDEVLSSAYESAEKVGRRPYLIPYGGSNPTGAAAYAYAIKELMDQYKDSPLDGQLPDWIVFPSSSGGTQAGMVVGKQVYAFSGSVLGISVDEPAELLKGRIAELANRTASYLGEAGGYKPVDILVNSDYLGEGYAVMGAAEREAMKLFARKEGLLLDPVYTGRAAAGLLDLIRKGYFKPEDRILFWHTGGTPALFVDRYQEHILE
jgi:D-cysteine desulfhydrase family pyridoxal phosphate-dependent enzyme